MKFSERLKELGFASYKEYLESETWANFKGRYRDSGLPMKCLVCDSARIQLHHTTYFRIGQERLTDVIPVCRRHHKDLHRIIKQQRFKLKESRKLCDMLRAGVGASSIAKARRIERTEKQKSLDDRRNLSAARMIKCCFGIATTPEIIQAAGHHNSVKLFEAAQIEHSLQKRVRKSGRPLHPNEQRAKDSRKRREFVLVTLGE